MAHFSCIAGGRSNVASGWYASIGGGRNHVNQGNSCAIPGGEGDTIGFFAINSLAFGKGVYVSDGYRVMMFNGNHPGRFGVNRDEHDGGLAHPIHVGTNETNGNGAYLSATGQWMNGSSRAFKEDFRPLNRDDLLRRIAGLPVESWRFKGTEECHIGPVAEDFCGAFGIGVVDDEGNLDQRYISPGDVAGVALAGVKELVEMIEELKARNDELEHRIAELEGERK